MTRKLLHPYSSLHVEVGLRQGRENLPALLEALTCYFQDAGFRVGALEPCEDEALHREWRERWEQERPLACRALAKIAAAAGAQLGGNAKEQLLKKVGSSVALDELLQLHHGSESSALLSVGAAPPARAAPLAAHYTHEQVLAVEAAVVWQQEGQLAHFVGTLRRQEARLQPTPKDFYRVVRRALTFGWRAEPAAAATAARCAGLVLDAFCALPGAADATAQPARLTRRSSWDGFPGASLAEDSPADDWRCAARDLVAWAVSGCSTHMLRLLLSYPEMAACVGADHVTFAASRFRHPESAERLAVLLAANPPKPDANGYLHSDIQMLSHLVQCPCATLLLEHQRYQQAQLRQRGVADGEAEQLAVCCMELLAGAGFRPTTFKNVHRRQHPPHPYDPLQRHSVRLDGCNRNLCLVMRQTVWAPDTHSQFPANARSAIREVFAIATCGRLGADPHPLRSLPEPLLLAVCEQAMSPVSAWLGSAR